MIFDAEGSLNDIFIVDALDPELDPDEEIFLLQLIDWLEKNA